MLLTAGTRLGPYLIEAPIGAGGMGEVYRALDTRLTRSVAIKILSSQVTSDTHSRQRFEREARAVAALEHPHICPVYDVGEHDGASFLVMQHLQGETLADRLRHGPLSLDEALRHATELAGALDAAHRAGVVHRDLKPGNVMVTKAGIKLLDFGLARIGPSGIGSQPRRPGEEPGASGAALPTTPANMTEFGTILGTLQYMAPEQLEGKPADARTDIFALGAVIYEMTTGRRAFEGDSQAVLIARILDSDPPPVSALRADASPLLDRVVRKCLAKDPDARWQSAGDLSDELNWVASTRNELPGQTSRSAPPAMRDARTWLLALALSGVAAFAAWVVKPSPRPAAGSRTDFIVDLPPNAQLRGLGDPTLAFSPDGRQLVYSAVVDGADRLFVRSLDNIESKPMVAAERATMPFFSPDGRWVGYSADRMLKRTPLGGGPALVIVQAPATGATWGPEGRVVFSGRSGLSQVSIAGGAVSQLTTPEKQNGERSHRWPEFLPGGRAVMFTAGPPPEGPWYDAQIVAQSLETGERHVLIRGAAQAHYVSTGHLVYARDGTLFAIPFDAGELRVGGPAVRVLEGVQEDQSQGSSQFTVSASGSLAYVNGGLRASEVIWVDRHGNTESFITPKEPRIFYQPRLSPDGRRLALVVASGDDDVWVYDVAQKVLGRFTSGANHGMPGWTPDGKRITFNRSGGLQTLLQSADRSGREEVILEGEPSQTPHCWSPDGRLLFFTQSGSKTGSDIWTVNIEDRKKQPVVVSPFNDRTPAISPSGQLLAYTSDESGRAEVYVQMFPGGGGRQQISRDGGTEPLWARNGKELFFRQGTRLMAVAIGAGTSFGSPHLLFDAPWMTNTSSRTNYDVSLDGQRFVAVRSIEPGSVPRIHVVLNWADELKRQAPK